MHEADWASDIQGYTPGTCMGYTKISSRRDIYGRMKCMWCAGATSMGDVRMKCRVCAGGVHQRRLAISLCNVVLLEMLLLVMITLSSSDNL